MNNARSIYSVISLSVFASLSGLLFGYDTGIISGAVLFIQPALQLSNGKIELVVGSVLFGAVTGAIFNSIFADQFSRRIIVCITAFQFMIGSLLCAMAIDLSFLLLGRFILGFAIGISSYIVPMYIAEVSPAPYRGGLVAFNTITVTFGMLLAYCVNYFLSPYHAWRLMLGLGFFPAFLLAIGIYFLPESPRWLIQQGKLKLGKDILAKLRINETEMDKEYGLIKNSHIKTATKWQDLLRNQYRLPLLIGLVLAALQQFSGINSILYYTPLYLTQYYLLPLPLSLQIAIGIGFTNLIMTIVAMLFVDRLGRRQLLLWGLAGIVVCLVLLSYLLPFVSLHSGIIWLVLIALFGFVSSYAISIGCIFWIIIAEIYPLSIRNTAMGWSSACNWISNLLVSSTFLTTVDHLGISATLLSYALFSAAGWLFCYLLIPETAHYILEESSTLISEYPSISGSRAFARDGV